MTRIDFYVLPGEAGDDAVMTACKLCDKAVASGSRVYVYAADERTQDQLDKLLWTFRQGSFIAHERLNGHAIAEPFPAVVYGKSEPPQSHSSVMINLGDDVPAFFSRFERVCEVVAGDQAQRAKSRTRYKFYRDRGYELKSFEQQADGGWKARA